MIIAANIYAFSAIRFLQTTLNNLLLLLVIIILLLLLKMFLKEYTLLEVVTIKEVVKCLKFIEKRIYEVPLA